MSVKQTTIRQRLRSFKRAAFLRDLFTRRKRYTITAALRQRVKAVQAMKKRLTKIVLSKRVLRSHQ